MTTTVTLGDFRVARLGFGAMRITGPGIWGPPSDRPEAMATLRRALELGVQVIDTAESYGPYVSEELIAEALYPYPPHLLIATKGGFDRPGPDRWVINSRPERLRDAVAGSLRRLRVERIDLYQLHRIDPAVPEDEQFDALQSMQREGLIRHVGLSEVSVAQVERARARLPIVSVQNRYNLADRQWEDVLRYCTDAGIVFIPWYPLNAGELVREGLKQYVRTMLGRTQGNSHVAAVARKHRATPSQIALAWLLQRSPIMLPIPGTSSRRHLDENMRATGIELSADDLAALE